MVGRMEENLAQSWNNVGRITAAGSYLFGLADVKYVIVRLNKFRL